MKLVVVFISLLLAHTTPPFMLVDRNLKKPPGYASAFTTEQYLQRSFPVYTNDVNEIIDAVDLAVKDVGKSTEAETMDSVMAAHTTLVINKNAAGTYNIDVTVLTRIDEINTSFSFALIRGESDIRRVQRKLLDFAVYLNQ